MNFFLASIGVSLSAIYAYFIWFLVGSRFASLKGLELNNLGDFLAGVFGPIAILWLVLGFFQQGYELRQNNKALKLQAEELKNSVDQQKEMVGIAGRQLEAELEKILFEREIREKTLLPSFKLTAAVPSAAEHLEVLVKVENYGNLAEDVELLFNENLVDKCVALDRGGSKTVKLNLPRIDADYRFRVNFKRADGKTDHCNLRMRVSVTNPGRSIAAVHFVPVDDN